MKIKEFNKKLSLNKKTIANLERSELREIGGAVTDFFSCHMEISCIAYTECVGNTCDV